MFGTKSDEIGDDWQMHMMTDTNNDANIHRVIDVDNDDDDGVGTDAQRRWCNIFITKSHNNTVRINNT